MNRIKLKQQFKLKTGIIFSTLIILITINFQAFSLGVTSNQPDMCRVQLHSNAQLFSSYTTAFGTGVNMYGAQETIQEFGNSKTPVVVLINGNGLGHSSYTDLSLHLANNGYFVIKIQRRNGNTATVDQVVDILDVIDDAFAMYQVQKDSPVGLIGHSVGGGVAMELVKLNQVKTNVYDIQSLITLAPKADFMISRNDSITSLDTPAYFSIYGSMDNDVTGYNDVYDAYSAYDYVGNEESTYDGNNPKGELFKSMLYIHGADHKSLVGSKLNDNKYLQDVEFIKTEDQFCITKAYVTSFLNWRMKNQTNFKEFFTPPYFIPHSVSLIKTSAPDYMGLINQSNPAGSSLRMFFQSSPELKSVVQAFNGIGEISQYLQSGDITLTDAVNGMVVFKEELKDDPFYIRNMTNMLALQWGWGGWHEDNQFIGFKVAESNQDASDFSHLSMRIGQVHNEELFVDGELYTNPPGEYQKIMLVLKDSDGKEVFTHLDAWGSIPFNDVRMNQGEIKGHSGFNSISVPLWAFKRRLNLSEIEYIGLVFHEGSTGTVIVDNMEWVKY